MKLSQDAIKRDRELYDPAIDWLLNAAQSELGETGTLAGTIGSLERGGQTSGVPNTDLYSNYQMGWCAGDSPAEKWRKWAPVWFRMKRSEQTILIAHYSPRNDLPEAQRVAVDGELGKLANAALWAIEGEALAKLIAACMKKDAQGRRGTIQAALRRADESVRMAHRAWQAVRETDPQGSPVVPGSIGPSPANEAKWSADYEKRIAERPMWETARAACLDKIGVALRKLIGKGKWVDAEESCNAA